MTKDDPDFPRGSLVVVTNNYGVMTTYTILKAVKGRETIRVCSGKYHTAATVPKKDARVITPENDPELFI